MLSFHINPRLNHVRSIQGNQKTAPFDYHLLFNDSRYWLLSLVGLLVSFAYFTPLFFLPTFATAATNGQISPQTASLILGLLNYCSAIGRITAGILGDCCGHINALIFVLTVSALSTIFLWGLASFATLPLIVIYAILYGLSSGGYIALFTTVIVVCIGRNNIAGISGVVLAWQAIGNFSGVIISTALLDKFGSYYAIILQDACFFLASVAIAVVLKMVHSKRTNA